VATNVTKLLSSRTSPVLFIILSASLFGVGTPFAKILVDDIDPIVLAGLLYIGAFVGVSIYAGLARISRESSVRNISLERKDAPWMAGATISGGIIAPICLMTGLTLTTGFAASLLLNLEGLATALIAYALFKENLGWKIGIAVICMTVAGVMLSWDTGSGAIRVGGPLLLLVAGIAWGIDNNLTRHISSKSPVQIAQVKGAIAGTVSLSVAVVLGLNMPSDGSIILALVLGSVSYGASLVLFVLALRGMGASRAGAFFSIGPFVGAVVSIVLLDEWLGWMMLPAAGLMLAGIIVIVYERHSHIHSHEGITHAHLHSNDDPTHDHVHPVPVMEPHVHEHIHPPDSHDHVHWPDIHHRHDHEEDGK
jgi:drug/metabolite transporter (DMT)-like permease